MTAPAVTVDVFSDVVCPWCFLGKRNLEAALPLLGDLAVEVRWRPFQLDPTIPPEGKDRTRYMLDKFKDPARIEAAHHRLETLGADRGIGFAFDRIKIAPNSLDAHRLIRWAAESGRQSEVVEGLFSAFFEKGHDLSLPETLVAVATDAGLDPDAVAADLASDRDVEAVLAEIAYAGRLGITGVPCYVLAGRYAVSGAQPPEVLADAIRQAAQPA
ncbi:DsbA family oxidoreductase [Methylobrevis albus]|uniref:DsbA family oxidoreductase n=1 Tax=Methylobrevis albus TaxID=2793297 RepID=A0A931I5M4_9HYPH|nr:DsbA family oxidoreductase [Methylobrevis albus]MBH0239731.1 DsbA family oxidoreductase [Methylobrevis albus]